MWSYMKFGQVVQEEMLFKDKVYGRTMDISHLEPLAQVC